MPRAALVVEDRYSRLLEHAYAPAGFLLDLLARVQVRYPEIPIVFLENRAMAEEWTYRYLGAAFADAEPEAPESSIPFPLDLEVGGPRRRARRTEPTRRPPRCSLCLRLPLRATHTTEALVGPNRGIARISGIPRMDRGVRVEPACRA